MTTAAEVLDVLDEFLSTADKGQRKALWDVLVSLRGPDSQDRALKVRTTARIRARAFPRAAAQSGPAGVTVFPMETVNQDGLPVHVTSEELREHFGWHAQKAWLALDGMGR